MENKSEPETNQCYFKNDNFYESSVVRFNAQSCITDTA